MDDDALTHDHVFLGADHRRNERRVWLVIALTTVMMMVEIGAGTVFGSMALVADGWHMSTHASALLISALAYLYARRQARSRRFTFGTGKFGDLAGFASAIVLALVALLMGWESLRRLMQPVAIDFSEAIAIAIVGLAVNLVSAWLLRDDHDHHHGAPTIMSHHHDHAHDHHGDHGGGNDNNLRSAYVHVIADAFTSVLAIAALCRPPLRLGMARSADGHRRRSGHRPMGLRAGEASARCCSMSLPQDEDLPAEIRAAIETGADRITDLHVWQVGPGHHAAIVSVVTPQRQEPSFYKKKLSGIHELSHVTVEVTLAGAA